MAKLLTFSSVPKSNVGQPDAAVSRTRSHPVSLLAALIAASIYLSGPVLGADLQTQAAAGFPAQAQSSWWDGLQGYIVGGIAALPKYEGANQYRVLPFLAGHIDYGGSFFQAEGLGAKFGYAFDSHFAFGAAIEYRTERDAIPLIGVPQVDASLAAGGFASASANGLWLPNDRITASVKVLSDVSGIEGGTTLTPSIGYGFNMLPNMRVGAELSTTYADDSYMRTYFSAPGYGAAAGFKDVTLGLTGTYFFTSQWGLTVRTSYKRLIGDAANSPVVTGQDGTPTSSSVA